MLYALVENNQIKVGPREYSKFSFVDYLSENNNSLSLFDNTPTSYNSINPIILSENISIIPVEEIVPIYNIITEELSGPFYSIEEALVTATYSVVDRPLDAIKNTLKSIIKENRYKVENTSINIVVSGAEVSVSTDRNDNRDLWSRVFNMMADNETRNFKFNEVWLNLSKSDVGAIAIAIDTHIQAAFDWEAGVVQQIDTATTKADLEAINVEYV